MVSRVPGVSVRRIEEGLRPALPSPSQAGGDSAWSPALPAEVVRARVTVAAVLPGTLTVACTAHAAAVGVPCFGRVGDRGSGACGERVRRRGAVAS